MGGEGGTWAHNPGLAIEDSITSDFSDTSAASLIALSDLEPSIDIGPCAASETPEPGDLLLSPSSSSSTPPNSVQPLFNCEYVIRTAYHGQWLPDGYSGCLIASRKISAHHASSAPFSTVPPAVQSALASVLIRAHADSGCSGSLTPNRAALVNTRPCSEIFKAADGRSCKAELIGDMPVITRDKQNRPLRIVFRNVRYVPDFQYTLLSVRQLWNEQRIDARFRDINALVVMTPSGELHLPYSSAGNLPTLELVSDTTGISGGSSTRSAALAAATDARPASASSRALGFHRVGSTSHVARLPAAQAAELLHRRGLIGVDKFRATPHTTADAPRVLASASAVPPPSAAVVSARIRRAPHSSTLSAPAPEPGVLHVDLKELVISIGGFRYVVFAIDEHSRYVFIDFIKHKSDVDGAVKRIIAAFDATVWAPPLTNLGALYPDLGCARSTRTARGS